MSKCLNCGVPIETNTGRRPRKFCGDNCRATYHQKHKPKERKFVQRATYERIFEKNKELESRLTELLAKSKPEIKEAANDIFDTGMAITETTEEGVRRIDPMSGEGLKVQNMAQDGQLVELDTTVPATITYYGKEKSVIVEDKNTPTPLSENEQRIKQLEAELKNPPKNPIIGLKKWTQIRKDEIARLTQQ